MSHASEEDVGNIVLLEHVNLWVPDQASAILFYVVGLGFTRDPYFMVALSNMWINVGQQQFHLPTRGPSVVDGHIGVVVPDLDELKGRLEGISDSLAQSRFTWSAQSDHLWVTGPWGNRFRCHGPGPAFGAMRLGIPYVELHVRSSSAW